MFQGFFQESALDIEYCVQVLIFPVELPTNLENILIIFPNIGILGRFFENVVVSAAVPYPIDTNKSSF